MQEEKKPMTREQYLERLKTTDVVQKKIGQDPHRLQFHLQPPMGWLNDPNGLCQIGDTYHIYFQYTPFNPEGGTGLWGHMTTKDFIHFDEHEPAIFPDSRWDINGAYSGSAFEENGTYYYFYTGNVKYSNQDYDYIQHGREQNVILTTSQDGFIFSEKQCIMTNTDYPEDMSKHVRDPQIVKKNGIYYMLLGARDCKNKGSALLFESTNLLQWKYKLRFTLQQSFGYMWECPNFIEIEDDLYLLACPQGIEQQGDDFANVYQCGYFPLSYKFGEDTYALSSFKQLDRGFDFYAPQVFKDHQNRTILIGWMGMPDSIYGNNITVEQGWQHALTIPRELYRTQNGMLAQRPLEELKALRREKISINFTSKFHIQVPTCFEFIMQLKQSKDFTMMIRESAILTYQCGVFALNMEQCGSGRTERKVKLADIKNIRIISDTSSLEIFINDGMEVFTTRIYDSMKHLSCRLYSAAVEGSIECYTLKK